MKTTYATIFAIALLATGCRSTKPQVDAISQSMIEEMKRTTELLAEIREQQTSLAQSPPPSNSPPDLSSGEIQKVAFRQPPKPISDSLQESSPPTAISSPMRSSMTLADLEGMALQNNPVIGEASARVAAAQGNWEQVGLRPNPVIGYSGQQLGSGGAAEQNGGYIGQEFVRGNKLGLNQEVAAWEVQKAQRELAVSRQRVLTDVRLSYYAVLIAQNRQQLAADLLSISTRGQTAADALFKADEVGEADPLRASVEVETARILLQTSTNQYTEAWRQLSAVLGMPGLAPEHLEGTLDVDSVALSWQETLQYVLAESPELGAANAEVEAARWAIQRACAEVIPNVEVQAVVQDDRSTGSVNGNLQVTFPLPLWNRNQGRIREANAEAVAADRAMNRLALDLQNRLAAAFQRYESASNRVEQYSREGGILDKTNRSLELIRKGYEADELDILDLLAAQRTYFETRLAFLDSQSEFWTSTTEIKGLLLRGSLAAN